MDVPCASRNIIRLPMTSYAGLMCRITTCMRLQTAHGGDVMNIFIYHSREPSGVVGHLDLLASGKCGETFQVFSRSACKLQPEARDSPGTIRYIKELYYGRSASYRNQ